MSDGVDTGALRFAGGRRKASHWAKTPVDLEPRQLGSLLKTGWRASLPEPQALFSVVGGTTDHFNALPAHTSLEFARGFSRAAQATGAWVVTGSASVGAARLVGGALHEAPEVPCVGVGAWTSVDKEQRDDLMRCSHHAQVCTLTTGRPKAPSGAAAGYYDRLLPDAAPAASDAALEPRVSHFLLADAEDDAAPEGQANALRRRLENLISPPQPAARRAASTPGAVRANDEGGGGGGSQPGYDVPMVLVVLGGGLDVLRAVKAALREERPVVVLPETGYAAADIADICLGGLPLGAMPKSFAIPAAGSPARSDEYRDRGEPLLREIRRLFDGRSGERGHPPVRSFSSSAASQVGDELPLTLIGALTGYYDTADRAAQAAVCWTDGAALRPSLSLCAAEDPLCLSRALEHALLARSAAAVEALLATQILTPRFVDRKSVG